MSRKKQPEISRLSDVQVFKSLEFFSRVLTFFSSVCFLENVSHRFKSNFRSQLGHATDARIALAFTGGPAST